MLYCIPIFAPSQLFHCVVLYSYTRSQSAIPLCCIVFLYSLPVSYSIVFLYSLPVSYSIVLYCIPILAPSQLFHCVVLYSYTRSQSAIPLCCIVFLYSFPVSYSIVLYCIPVFAPSQLFIMLYFATRSQTSIWRQFTWGAVLSFTIHPKYEDLLGM